MKWKFAQQKTTASNNQLIPAQQKAHTKEATKATSQEQKQQQQQQQQEADANSKPLHYSFNDFFAAARRVEKVACVVMSKTTSAQIWKAKTRILVERRLSTTDTINLSFPIMSFCDQSSLTARLA